MINDPDGIHLRGFLFEVYLKHHEPEIGSQLRVKVHIGRFTQKSDENEKIDQP
jgi:hypothetical protein